MIRIFPRDASQLRVVCEEVKEFDDLKLAGAEKMFRAEMARQSCYAIAAPQIGLDRRLFMVSLAAGRFPMRVFINPTITDAEGEQQETEGCLSLPSPRWDIKRAQTLVLHWRDPKGGVHHDRFSGLEAQIVQHEVDHLDGVLLTDRLQQQLPRMLRQQRRQAERYLKKLGAK